MQKEEIEQLLKEAISPDEIAKDGEISHLRYTFNYVNNKLRNGDRIFDGEDFEDAEEILDIFRQKGWKIETSKKQKGGSRGIPNMVTEYIFS